MNDLVIYTAVAGLAWGMACHLASDRARWRILDQPNDRSLHHKPVARTGGVAVWLAWLAGLAWLASTGPTLPGWWTVLLMALLGAADDRWSLPVRVRLPLQLLLALAALLALAPQQLWLAADLSLSVGTTLLLLLTLALVWMVNLYNFMDGMDGFAGGMALIGFATLALAARPASSPVAAMAWLSAAAAGGFLIANFPPARLFLGDVGSLPLGLLVGLISLWGASTQALPLWLPLLVFSPFWVDATVTLLRRLLRGDKIWQAHREHAYQLLVRGGWTHRRTVLGEYLLMLICAGMALRWRDAGWAEASLLLLAAALLYLVLGLAVARHWRRKRPEIPS